jgi:phosphoribosylformylglycinamidine synthase
VYRQYDHQLFLNTVEGPGGDAALLKLAGPGLPESVRGIAVSTDSAPRWCALDPAQGVGLVIAESLSNLACVGARGVAVVNCLNFGNPEHPEVMWQLSETVDGMTAACLAFGLPVIGGNVSLYNESGGRDIDPTPVVGLLGLVDELRRRPPGAQWRVGDTLVLLGAQRSSGPVPFPLGGTRWAVERAGHRRGSLPVLDVAAHRAVVDLVASVVSSGVAGGSALLSGVHDVSGGGLAMALAEMAARSGVGAVVEGIEGPDELFCEVPGRFVVAVPDADSLDELSARASAAGVPCEVLGHVAGGRLVVRGLSGDLLDLGIEELGAQWKEALPVALGEPV